MNDNDKTREFESIYSSSSDVESASVPQQLGEEPASVASGSDASRVDLQDVSELDMTIENKVGYETVRDETIELAPEAKTANTQSTMEPDFTFGNTTVQNNPAEPDFTLVNPNERSYQQYGTQAAPKEDTSGDWLSSSLDGISNNNRSSGSTADSSAASSNWSGASVGGGNGNIGGGGHGSNGGGRTTRNGGPNNRKPKNDSPYVTKKFLAVVLAIGMVVSAAVGAFAGALLGGSSKNYSNLSSNSSIETATGSTLTIEEIVSMNADAVVEINTTSVSTGLMGSTETEGAGSGVIVNSDGYIVTNYHVIEGANSIVVILRNGDEYKASVVGYDEFNDIAVLKIKGSNFTAATIGNSSELQVGDLSVAIGNPLGQLGGTATSGIISALDRQLSIDGTTLTLLQTDTAINPGNSGGGLFNDKGELVGIVVAKSSGSDVEGLGFAIPIDTAAPIIDDIIENGTVSDRAIIGVNILDISEDRTSYYGVSEAGIYIAQVYGENAEKAGLESGDRIVAIDGETYDSSTDLIKAVQSHEVGDKVKITISRDGIEQEITVELESYNDYSSTTSSSSGNSYDSDDSQGGYGQQDSQQGQGGNNPF